MFGFINQIFNAPLKFAKKFASSPMGTLFYGIISKWYLISMTLMVIVLYWVMSGLNKAGVLDLAEDAFTDAGKQIKGFAQHCTPLVKDLNAFLRCMMDTPEYTGDDVTNLFEQDIKKDIRETIDHPVNHNKIYLLSPYDAMISKGENQDTKSPDQ